MTKRSGMTIEDNGEFERELPPVLDIDKHYEARVLGFANIGKQESDEWKSGRMTGKKITYPQAVVVFELTEDETLMEYGEEGELARRQIITTQRYSANEGSNLYKIVKAANSKAAWIEDKKAGVDPTLILNKPLSLELKLNGNKDRNYFKDAQVIPAKYQKDIPDIEGTPFMFCAETGTYCDTSIKDVPFWILKQIRDAVNAESLGQIEAVETELKIREEEYEAAKDDSGKLEGDDKKVDKKPKKTPKTPKTSRRRGKKGSKESDEFDGKTIEDMEDYLDGKGVEDGVFDTMSEEFPEDDDYLSELKKYAKNL